jgi:hypothetical protein
MLRLCAPVIIHNVFALTQIIIDTIKGLYNTAFIKLIVTILISILLQILCDRGLKVVAWIIVFIPFIFMTFIISLLLYIFGLDIATGKLRVKNMNTNNNTGNLIYSSNDETGTNQVKNTNNQTPLYTLFSSDPKYESFM